MPPSPLARPVEIPSFFRCPISLSLMRDPVTLASGISYDRPSIETWLDEGKRTCPLTMADLGPAPTLIPNHALRRLIQDWCVANRSRGVERIATPPAPAEPALVASALRELRHAASPRAAVPLVRQLRCQAKKSERNRRCIHHAGALPVLLDLLASPQYRPPLDTSPLDKDLLDLLQESVGLLALLFPSSQPSPNTSSIVPSVLWLLNNGSIDARVNSALLLSFLAAHPPSLKLVASSPDSIAGLASLLRESLYPMACKTSLRTLLALYGSPAHSKSLALHQPAVHSLIELLPGAGKSTSECILALLRSVSSCAEGRALIRDHALALPSIVRSLLLATDVANEHAISILWSICLSEDAALEEAAQLGAAQKLIVLAQMNCPPSIKQKSKDLLKGFTSVGCADMFGTSDFRL